MNSFKWLPLRYIIRKAAHSQGFLDPIELMARMRSLAQPSEVGEPIELLRAGVVFHARGLINSKVIQHNLDWIWPYWIEKQYDPADVSFIPRAFSVTHINLTHRNWTAIGYPDIDHMPIVDPRGLLTPFMDGWSLDACLLTDDGQRLVPSRTSEAGQHYERRDGDDMLSVETSVAQQALKLKTRSYVTLDNGRVVCKQVIRAEAREGGKARLALLLRPANPEGVSFINDIAFEGERNAWHVNGKQHVFFDRKPDSHHLSDYHSGDVFNRLEASSTGDSIHCKVGLATAAAIFEFDGDMQLTLSIPLDADKPVDLGHLPNWQQETGDTCRFSCPEQRYTDLYDAAISSLVLHSPGDVYPGPYTYKRFWFRDAAFIIHALLCCNLEGRATRALDRFPQRQTARGYFRSQEGEWDANGEVLWILRRYEQLCNTRLDESWHSPILKGAKWIINKRVSETADGPHAGLMPAGFSAEHLGPNDYYYWDDFWSIAGLRAAAELLADTHAEDSERFSREARDFSRAVDRSLASCEARLQRPGMPASPYRRLDAGAIGSIASGYPLQLSAADDPRLLDCVEYLLEHCFLHDAFFQDMIHSGLNAYLTMQVAQVLMRAGDPRYLRLMDSVVDLATSTGQWPEAIHPQTRGGCMGDGHHVWASAEWVLLLRSCFVMEEDDGLVLCAGIPGRWLEQNQPLHFGPTPTAHGRISISVEPGESIRVRWDASWYGDRPRIDVRLPGYRVSQLDADGAWLERDKHSKEVSAA